jgi:hypothetical protein
MWAVAISELNTACREEFQDSTLTLVRGAAAHTCRCIFDAPHDLMTPNGDGSVGVSSYQPSATINTADFAVTPAIDESVSIARDLPDGTQAAAQTYRIADVQPNGYNVLKLILLETGGEA